MPLNRNARGFFGFWQKGDSFRDALLSLLNKEGGDFQNALFSADTVIRIERRTKASAKSYSVHVWERPIDSLPDCADLVDADAFVSDFMGDCE